MSEHKYDNEVGPYNAYGRCLELLSRNVAPSEGVHLDLACGLGPIATHVVASHGVHYVGVDFDSESVERLRGRGFEAHQLDLNAADVGDSLRTVLDGRPLASISMLDGLEHLVAGDNVLRAISSLLAEHRTVCILSVPNVTHVDVAVKALLGEWTYTASGLLDETHYRLFSGRSLEETLRGCGLARIDEADVVLAESDQHFPADHGALSASTPIGSYLRNLRGSVEPHGLTNQFVWAVTPAPERPVPAPEEDAPFLSVLMRTQGRRTHELREVLLCLSAQSFTDFEVVLTAHKVDVEQQIAVERIIADQPADLRGRIRLLLLDTGGRAAPLNHSLRHARGSYCVILDDDDLVLEHWAATFHAHAAAAPGRIVRSLAVAQETVRAEVQGLGVTRAVGPPEARFATEFSLLQHLTANQSPAHTWAFPRSMHRDFAMEFDESMSTTEDWEFLLRAVSLVGVTNVPLVTAIYHWWGNQGSSRTSHPFAEWRQNHSEVERRMDSAPFLLPTGETRDLRERLMRLAELEGSHRHSSGPQTPPDLERRLHERNLELARVRKMLDKHRKRNKILQRRVKKLQAQAGGGSKGSRQAAVVAAPAGAEPSALRKAARRVKRGLA